ncbi:hypothetical protein BpHYR1_049661 [Brachionus plicatilis]|uniref:Uncharacterized protein n=1 Tax=Brachionus plicatilis TaxID=10195 RepID=A0A3M7R5V3_BRAPC|nr:hypothetical protein BpHYR1_049661 [Brachionus plicatilis]
MLIYKLNLNFSPRKYLICQISPNVVFLSKVYFKKRIGTLKRTRLYFMIAISAISIQFYYTYTFVTPLRYNMTLAKIGFHNGEKNKIIDSED